MKKIFKQRRIALLPTTLRNQIAAGEVVERPASVLKELVENSLDAGATEVIITLEDGGQTMLSVKDNGNGIAPEDLKLAVTRHATSKVSTFDELTRVTSYGFRGEALPSIASVSQLRIDSAWLSPDDNQLHEGSFLEIKFGEVVASGPSPIMRGTTVTLHDLFVNVPARLKFLKTPSTELKRCQDALTRFGLAKPDVSFSLFSGKKELLHMVADAPLRQRLNQVWPDSIVENLIEFSATRNSISVSGFTSLPHNLQSKGDRILLYVNGRPVSSRLLLTAIREAYKGRILSREYPQAVLFVEIDPQEIDVNVHPAKTEVRFREERAVFSAVLHAIQSALMQKSPLHQEERQETLHSLQEAQEIDLINYENQRNQDTATSMPRPSGFWGSLDSQGIIGQQKKAIEENYEAIHITGSHPEDFIDHNEPFTSNIHSSNVNESITGYLSEPFQQATSPSFHKGFPVRVGSLICHAQIAKTYLVLQQNDDLLLLDQHAAHERVRLHSIKKQINSEQSQLLAIPFELKLHSTEKERLKGQYTQLISLGYSFKNFDNSPSEQLPDNIHVLGLPAFLSHTEAIEALQDILADRTDGIDDLLHFMACRSAIKAGQILTHDEIAELLEQWMATPDNLFCPHGRPIVLKFEKNDLEKMFKRISR